MSDRNSGNNLEIRAEKKAFRPIPYREWWFKMEAKLASKELCFIP